MSGGGSGFRWLQVVIVSCVAGEEVCVERILGLR